MLTADLGRVIRNIDFAGTECGGAQSYMHGERRIFAVKCGEHVVVLSDAMARALAAEVSKLDDGMVRPGRSAPGQLVVKAVEL